ncbi:hypothetical protein L7Q78_10300 [Achromobacter xylosoxidans]|uniref:hypothetical protein n=1 Tax=Alcaligenes xylosoxydans xylosoxydans TaxID=85698 RepID=UPI001F06ACF6|nr:hypothetical protein [Achromobacter xylosoxidans]MCH1984694.1 hypothetical protein [Achromobacter xylosoxidans]MCH1993162.1 hypothetical protein [Achromobacter xylosoxidans]MCH4586413.1 hypothetical protein [Achromobacter xylosoxidans]
MYLDDSSVITSRRAQSPLQNQAHTARWQGLQTGQDIIIESLGKGSAQARLVAQTVVDRLRNASDLIRLGWLAAILRHRRAGDSWSRRCDLHSTQEPSLPTLPAWLTPTSAEAAMRTRRQLSRQKMRCFQLLGFQIVLR